MFMMNLYIYLFICIKREHTMLEDCRILPYPRARAALWAKSIKLEDSPPFLKLELDMATNLIENT